MGDAHGGLQQKWVYAFDEAIRVPLLVSGPGIVPRSGGISTPTSHSEVHPLPGRDINGLLTAQASKAEVVRPIYFMSEADVSCGRHQINLKRYSSPNVNPNAESLGVDHWST